MAILASTILTETLALLNDPTGAIYQSTPMWPIINKAYRELQTKVSALGIGTTKELSAAIDVPALTLFLADGALLPADLIYPISLQERADGSTNENDWVDMEEWELLPSRAPETRLIDWAWREEQIKFISATTAREVKIRYVKGLGSVTGGTSSIQILNSEQWLAQRSAALASLLLGSNPTRASALDTDLTKPGGIWDDLKATMVKRQQAVPVRRRRTRYRVP